jgi:cytochrome d ubiquinol oxidase subunit I
MNVVTLSRIQFALTIMFHYLFPPLTISMGVVLVYLESRFLWTRDDRFRTAGRFWTEVFALNFGMGVVTGIVMEFQFGTNWANYSRFVGDVFGSALAAEGIFAFFLESGFLAILVFGWDRVGPRLHFFSTCMDLKSAPNPFMNVPDGCMSKWPSPFEPKDHLKFSPDANSRVMRFAMPFRKKARWL